MSTLQSPADSETSVSTLTYKRKLPFNWLHIHSLCTGCLHAKKSRSAQNLVDLTACCSRAVSVAYPPHWSACGTPWRGGFWGRSDWWSWSSCRPRRRSAGGGRQTAARPPSAQMAYSGSLLQAGKNRKKSVFSFQGFTSLEKKYNHNNPVMFSTNMWLWPVSELPGMHEVHPSFTCF